MCQQLKLWELVPASGFDVPAAAVDEAARGHTRRVWMWINREILRRTVKVREDDSSELRGCSASELGSICPGIDWTAAATALSTGLMRLVADGSEKQAAVCCLVAPPGCGVADILESVAREHRLTVFPSPTSNVVLGDEEAQELFLRSLDGPGERTLVVPRLERFFLRHEAGMALVQLVAKRLLNRGRVLLGCDSWSWAFLQRAMGIEDLFGTPWTIAPFDAIRLNGWLRSTCDRKSWRYLQHRTEQPVFPDSSERNDRQRGNSGEENSGLIKSLAAMARGNLGVAHALWRSSLRFRDPLAEDAGSVKQSSRSTIFVVSPTSLEPPAVRNGMDRLNRFILHAILIHGGVPSTTLEHLLPFSPPEICLGLSELRAGGFIEERDGVVQIALPAYPEVRQEMVREGFLTDNF